MNAVPISRDASYDELKDYVVKSTGLAYYQSRDQDFQERISRRLRSVGVASYEAYLALLRGNGMGRAELDNLIAELTIGETFFFRDEHQFKLLRDLILPDILRRNRSQKALRVWSAGCASGPEAYSLSIVLRDELREHTEGWAISILGTDVNRRLLAQADEGRYERWALRSTPEEVQTRCFRREGCQWRIAERFREGVSFQYQNLVEDRAGSWLGNPGGFDLIFCRNVMIYFDRPTAAVVVERLHDSMAPGGWLVVGHADHDPHAFRTLEVVTQSGVTVYRKLAAATMAPAPAIPRPAEVSPLVSDASWSEEGLHSIGSVSIGPEDAGAAPAAPSAASLEDTRALASLGEWAEAESLCAALIEKNPLDALAHFYHALFLERLGRPDQAERSLRRVVYLDRRFTLAHYHLGLLLWRGGRRLAARRCFENVLALLADIADGCMVEHGDGIQAADLRNLIDSNLGDLG